jgi:hypothetical protein
MPLAVVESTPRPERDSNKSMLRLRRFGEIKREYGPIWPPTSTEATWPLSLVRDLLRFALEHVRFDERYYLRSNPDVAGALADGLFANAHNHYVEFGYFEDRLPFHVEVDNAFYYRAYPDIKACVDSGTIPSAQAHFERHGYKEGRLPRDDWSLFAS